MIKRYVLYCAGILLLAACGGKNEKQHEKTERTIAEDSVATGLEVDSVLSEQEILLSNETGLTGFVKSKKPAFDWKRFQLKEYWSVDSFISEPFSPDKNFYEAYGKLLKYSSDSSSFIDLDSYNISIKKDTKGNLIGEEVGPDTEVSLVNTKINKRMRLLFLGPGGSIEDARWIDKNNLLLFGTYANDSGISLPAIWKINVPEKAFFLYEINDASLAGKLTDYTRKVRLKAVSMK